MLNVERICKEFDALGVDFFTGVPDSLLKNFCAYLTDHMLPHKHIIAANEGVAVGLAAGHYLATSRIPLVYMQNSGLGNTVNPLLSLADEQVYALPILLMIGWRGEPGVKDEPQHVKQGQVTIDLLEAMQIPYIILSDDEDEAVEQLATLVKDARVTSKPHAIVIRKDTFAKYKLVNVQQNDFTVSREDAMKLVIDHLNENDVVVSTTGKLSREVFEYREFKQQGHQHDFLTVGSMGHSSSIALGIALEKPERDVFCLDGDGAFIMHMGAISNIGKCAPGNYYHILFNNGAHESVGGQPTLGFSLDVKAIAKACGYRHVVTAQTKSEMEELLAYLHELEGPVMVELCVGIHSRDNLGRPTTTPIENKNHFMEFLSK